VKEKLRDLTLAEALRSGRPFRRFFETVWREPSEIKVSVTLEDIEAKDYIIKPERVRIRAYVSPCRNYITTKQEEADWSWDLMYLVEEE
jgi:hypothetical protein